MKARAFAALLEELDTKREVTVRRAAVIYGKTFSPSTWKRIKRELAAEGCRLRWNAKTKRFTVIGSWTRSKAPKMDPRKRELLALLRVAVSRLGSPFVEGIGPQLDRWDEQLSELDPSATEQLPPRQPQPRMDKIYFDCLKTAEGAVRNHTILRFKYRRSRDGVESRRAIAPYELFDYTGRIYVWGPEEGAHHPKFFAIDRMTEAASKEGDVFKPDAELRLDNWLKHSFGIYISGDGSTRPAEKRNVLRIVVRFARNRAADVNARRWPAEVKRKNLADGSVEMIFEVDDPREIVAWVLSFGGDAKITAPPEAAEMARHFADAILTDHKWAERVPVDERLLRFDWVAD